MSWELTYSATTQTLAAWGITSMVKESQNLGPTVLNFSVTVADASVAADFPHGASIVVKWNPTSGDDIIWFRGTIVDPQSTFTGESQTKNYRAEGSWRKLVRTPLMQLWKDKINDENVKFGLVFLTLKVDGVTTPPAEANGTSITRMVQSAIDDGRSIAIGTIDAGIRIPAQRKKGMQVSEGILNVARWSPSAVGWFNDAPSTPTFSWRLATNLTEVEFDISEVQMPIKPNTDLVVPAVRICYMKLNEPTEEDEETESVRYSEFVVDKFPTDMTGSEEGRLELPMGYTDFIDGTPPSGLAETLFEAFNANGWSGSIRHQGQELIAITEPTRAPLLGRKINITGGMEAWETMGGIIQTTSEDVFSGITTATFGPPEHLSPQDIIALAMMNRKRSSVSAGDLQWQFEGKKPNDGGGDIGPQTRLVGTVLLSGETTVKSYVCLLQGPTLYQYTDEA